MNAERHHARGMLFAIFMVSGFSGLIYESIWSHYLKLFLGHAAYAQTLVLAIFMGGMALGSWLTARRSHKIRDLLLAYVVVEGIIGLLGLVFHPVSTAVTGWVFDSLLPGPSSPSVAQLAKWLVGAALILPQSILLGATFPLMSSAIIRRFPQSSGETLAMLYFTNSLGAAVGVLMSGFVLIEWAGLPGTILTAGLLNIALALVVWALTKAQPTNDAPAPAHALAPAPAREPPVLCWMLAGAALTGAAAFLYEIAWIRMLSLVLGSSTHSFELMLSAFILGIALGGLWVRRRVDRLAEPVRFLGILLVVMACVALASLPVYERAFDLMATAVKMFSPTVEGYAGFNVASHAIAMLVMIPTTFFCGMTLPVMTHVLIRQGVGERAIGAVYSWNTAGAIVGVIVAVHVLMPWIGVKGIVISGATVHLALGLAYLARGVKLTAPTPYLAASAATGVAALALAAFTADLNPSKLVSGVFRHGVASHASASQIRLLRHGKTATVSLVDVEGHVTIATNGKPDAAINMRDGAPAPDEITMVLAGALPVALHPNPRRVANIGIGSGLTSHVLLATDAVQKLDTIEIEPVMAEAAELGFLPRVRRTFRDPRSHLHFEDAKSFFAVNRGTYDVIVSEPSNPWVSGVATLFSREFYRHVAHYLEPDGLLVQWIQIYETDLDVLISVMKALAPEFEDFALYSTDDENLLLVARRTGSLPSPSSRMFESQALRDDLARVGIASLQDVNSRYLGNKKLLLPLLRYSSVPANSDYFPFVDLNAPRARVLRRNALELSRLPSLSVPLFEMLADAPPARDRTVPSPHPRTARDNMVLEAAALRDALETSSYDGLSPQAASVLMSLWSPAAACTQPGVRRAWLMSAYYVAERMNTALSPSELEPIWDRVAAAPCAASLHPDEQEFLGLLRALGLRDSEATAKHGANLFARDYPFTGRDELTTALLGAATASIAISRPDQAIQLMQKYSGATQGTPAAMLAARILGSLATAQWHEARAAAAPVSNTAAAR